jgi:hypothetical protein
MRPPIISLARTNHPIRSVYVFGQRNSGTNYVNALIHNNLLTYGDHRPLYDPRDEKDFGWKHGFPNLMVSPDDVLAVVVYRDPIAWLQSLHRMPWHAVPSMRGLSFSEFIRAEWISVVDDLGFGVTPESPLWGSEILAERDPKTRKRFSNAIHMRNAKIASFRNLHSSFENCLHLRYEDVLANPKALLVFLASVFGLARRSHFDPVIYDRGRKVRGLYAPRPIDPINTSDMDFIRAELDQGQEKRLGYTLPNTQTAVQLRIMAGSNGEIDAPSSNVGGVRNLMKQNAAIVSPPTHAPEM